MQSGTIMTTVHIIESCFCNSYLALDAGWMAFYATLSSYITVLSAKGLLFLISFQIGHKRLQTFFTLRMGLMTSLIDNMELLQPRGMILTFKFLSSSKRISQVTKDYTVFVVAVKLQAQIFTLKFTKVKL